MAKKANYEIKSVTFDFHEHEVLVSIECKAPNDQPAGISGIHQKAFPIGLGIVGITSSPDWDTHLAWPIKK